MSVPLSAFRFVSVLRAGLGLVAVAGSAHAAAPAGDVNVVVDMTEAGRQIAAPTSEHPAFYLPLVIGYREEGEKAAGNHAPPQEEVLKVFAEELAQHGYRVMNVHRGAPTLLLVFSWGVWNPVTVQLEEGGSSVALNAPELSLLVAGNTVKNLPIMPRWMTNIDREELRSDLKEDRFFAIVTAFKWTDQRPHQHVLLWTAKMSIPSRGLAFDQVLPALIATGGPFFGRETTKRQQVTVPLLREGRVNLGELQVKGIVSPDEMPAAAKQPKEKQP
jgi:hypothetical protein